MQYVKFEEMSNEQWDFVKSMYQYVRDELNFHPKELCYFFIYRFCISAEFVEKDVKEALKNYANHHNALLQKRVFEWKTWGLDSITQINLVDLF